MDGPKDGAPPAFRHEETVTFGQVDAAGIVFYPRLFEMVSNTVEAWFARGLGRSFARLHLEDGFGTPTVEIAARFAKACRLGERLAFDLTVDEVGRSRIALAITGSCEGEARCSVAVTLVFVRLDPFAAAAIPDDLRARIETFRRAKQAD